ncbi:MAG: glutamate--tRNA ligase [Candidatus Pacebacteria bacterium]|nr:glutamate--tRNA ligase [Candidatus Paceibacterota bacterium]
MSAVRVRFAPSPTGNVHIGNIRAAIFNWLFARHEDGTFLLRVEDTDRERSTPEAIANLLSVMEWLGLGYDEQPLYQSTQEKEHLAAARQLIDAGKAYLSAKNEEGRQAVIFRIPWDTAECPAVSSAGPATIQVHPDVPVQIVANGVNYAQVSKKGKPIPAAACLAGFKDLEILDESNHCIFRLNNHIAGVLDNDRSFEVDNAAQFRFTRRQVHFHDLVKGTLAKPLDSMKDLVIVRSDSSPVFHLANVCDDSTQGITHIIRGDDHVENTYRHILLYYALGKTPPTYAHLPMIVNDQGKPYSKRDGDAFVGDFRDKGYLPHALFNYLTLLGWSPGDDREKLSREELIQLFSLERVQSAAARMDLKKLDNLNGQYMAELPFDEFLNTCRTFAETCDWFDADAMDTDYFASVAELLHTRTKRFTDVCEWDYFFREIPDYDEKACGKFFKKLEVRAALTDLAVSLKNLSTFTPETIERAVHAATEKHDIKHGKLNQPLRVAVTGRTTGAGIYETIALLGPRRTETRITHASNTYFGEI